MQPRWMGAALTLAVGISTLAASAPPAPVRGQEELTWLPSYAQARTAARQTGKPIFLVFR